MTNLSSSLFFHQFSIDLNRYFAPLIFTFGMIGNLLNCFILSQRELRYNPCAIYFLTSSIVNLISIVFGLTTRILDGWQLDPTSEIDWICKVRTFVVFTSRTMALWLIVLATIDRWLSSSLDYQRRRLSTKSNAYRGIIFSFLLSFIAYIHMIFCYKAKQHDAPLQCYGKSVFCRLLTDSIYFLVSILIPSVLLIGFCILIVLNVHRIRHRTEQTNHTPLRPFSRAKVFLFKKIDHQLLRMLLVQAILLIIFCIPQAIQKFHISLRPFDDRRTDENTIKRSIYKAEAIVAYVANGVPFYLYTLSGGTIFRRATKKFFLFVLQKMKIRL